MTRRSRGQGIALFVSLVLVMALNVVAGAAPSGVIQLYTSQPDADAAETVAAFEQAYPGVKVKIFRSGTEEVISRFLMEAEAGAPQADVLLVADAPTFEILKSKGLLLGYKSPEAAKIDRIYYDDRDYTYFGTKIISTIIVYNSSLAKPISSWKEFAAKGSSAIMPSPNYSGAAAYNLGVITRTPELGWDWYEDLQKGHVMLTKGNGAVLRSVASGERPYGMIVEFVAIRAKLEGSPVEPVFPVEGVPSITEPVGIVAGTKNPEAAKAFVDFLLSKSGQELASSMGYMPLRDDVNPPAGFPELSKLKVLSRPANVLAETREADKERFSALFGQ